jgi:carbonic anhydrase
MKKLIQGIIDFRQKALPDYSETFARLALGQAPDALFIACSDSRVAPNVFASTNPGDLFVVRNVGNIVPPWREQDLRERSDSVGAAIEFAVKTLHVKDIIICGHSECGAMLALQSGRENVDLPQLRGWLQHAEKCMQPGSGLELAAPPADAHNCASQKNVLLQMTNLKTHPAVADAIRAGTISVHGWWFELKTAAVHAYAPTKKRFVVVDESML